MLLKTLYFIKGKKTMKTNEKLIKVLNLLTLKYRIDGSLCDETLKVKLPFSEYEEVDKIAKEIDPSLQVIASIFGKEMTIE